MNKDNNNQINTSIPEDILKIIKTGMVYKKLEIIGNKYNLFIDQLGQLNADTEMVMVGKIKSDSFVKIIADDLEIDMEKALAIAKDVNTEILDSIRESLRKIQEQEAVTTDQPTETTQTTPPQPKIVTTVEPSHAEKQQMIASVEHAGDLTIDKPHVTSSPQYNDTDINREEALKHIEDATHAVPLVDHLLTTPVSNPQVVEEKSYPIDPYKEQI